LIFDFRFAIGDLNRQSKIGNRKSVIWQSAIENRQLKIERRKK